MLGAPLSALLASACGADAPTAGTEPPLPPRSDASVTPIDFGGDAAAQTPSALPSFAPGTRLWSWTTAEQAAELRRDRVLFTRTERPGGGPGSLWHDLVTLRADPVARHAIETLAKGRFTWLHPWATALGFADESYGDVLLEIELRPDSLFLAFERGRVVSAPIVVDVQGQRIDTPNLTKLAGVLYASKTGSRGSLGAFCPATTTDASGGCSAYREVYLGNASQVVRWSLAGARVRARLLADAAFLEDAASLLPTEADAQPDQRWLEDLYNVWPTRSPNGWEARLAFLSARYRPVRERWLALAQVCRARVPRAAPLEIVL
jgi:hypothetical protein